MFFFVCFVYSFVPELNSVESLCPCESMKKTNKTKTETKLMCGLTTAGAGKGRYCNSGWNFSEKHIVTRLAAN